MLSGPVLRAALIGAAATSAGAALTVTSGWLVVRASERPIILTLIVAIVLVRTFGLARPALRYLERLRSHDAALSDLIARRVHVYRALIPLTPARLGRRRRADLLTGFVHDLDDIVEAQVRAVGPLVSVATVGALAVALTCWLYAPVGGVVAAQMIIALLVTLIGRRSEQHSERSALHRRAEVARAVHMATANTMGLQAISATDWAVQQLDSAENRPANHGTTRAVMAAILTWLTGLAMTAAAAVLAPAVLSGAVQPPVAAMLLLTPLAMGEALEVVPDAVRAAARASIARGRMADLLGQRPAVSANGRHPVTTSPHELSTHSATVTWQDGEPMSLPDITIRQGEHVTLTGPNGCGKSTMLALLARHLDPATGSVRIDDRDVLTLQLDDVRRHVALVDDEPHIFDGSVRANMLLAQPAASDAEIVRALDHSGLGRWLSGLGHGLDTAIGTHGSPLSGGERARLAIARAVLSERPFLLLDEPFGHLDHPTARQILVDLHLRASAQAILLVSHQRLGEEGADRVIRWHSEITPTRATVGRTREGTSV
ncbi:thiol reductant ABC exporter subunit CydC [Demetria terragena]|uniref:thiol reductant ABC exporter subunit CydC n=1 Tax=Demetria terragena TaxID=63959 RepID=UPI000366617B|nr:thiol reductant ABC exporter subunit CydC [Demetria terragena]